MRVLEVLKTWYFPYSAFWLAGQWGGYSPPAFLGYATGQNWGKIANYPPQCQQRSAPLIAKQMGPPTCRTLRRIIARTKDRLGFDGN